MRLVEDQDRPPAGLVILEQELGERQSQLLLAFALEGQGQVIEDRLQEAGPAAAVAIGEEGTADAVAQAVQQAVAQHSLAQAGLAGQQRQPFFLLDSLEKLGEGVLVAGRRVIAPKGMPAELVSPRHWRIPTIPSR